MKKQESLMSYCRRTKTGWNFIGRDKTGLWPIRVYNPELWYVSRKRKQPLYEVKKIFNTLRIHRIPCYISRG